MGYLVNTIAKEDPSLKADIDYLDKKIRQALTEINNTQWLPTHWSKEKTPEGATFYKNHKTGETRRKRPFLAIDLKNHIGAHLSHSYINWTIRAEAWLRLTIVKMLSESDVFNTTGALERNDMAKERIWKRNYNSKEKLPMRMFKKCMGPHC